MLSGALAITIGPSIEIAYEEFRRAPAELWVI
jgi:hypothetical protein